MQDNCLLSSQEVSQLVNTNNLQVDNGWDLYARLESGYNCRSSESGEMNYNYIITFLISVSDCFSLERSLYKHYSPLVRSRLTAESLQDCSARCHSETFCNTFSYGEREVSFSQENCLLSDTLRTDLSVSSDLVSEAYWSVYSINGAGSSRCTSSSSTSTSSQCYREEREGFKYYNDVVRDVRTAASLEDCSVLCHEAHYCRSFTFK